MANKALILGAAMAYKNQGSPLVGSITKAVDASLGSYLKIMEAEQQKLSKASLITQQYLDSLPANPEIDLLDDNLSTMFTSELNSARNEIGRLNMIRYADPFTYSPGSEAYTNITSATSAVELNDSTSGLFDGTFRTYMLVMNEVKVSICDKDDSDWDEIENIR